MSFDTYLRPWSGFACRHIADDATYDILDFSYAGRGRNNRWNVYSQPTLYLASDHRVAIAEFARHFGEDVSLPIKRPETVGWRTVSRRIYDLTVRIERMLDLRDPSLCGALALSDAPSCFLDRAITRATAQFLRQTTPAQALLVPSVALLDQPDRYALVLFLEKLHADPRSFVTSVRRDGIFHFGDREPTAGGGGSLER